MWRIWRNLALWQYLNCVCVRKYRAGEPAASTTPRINWFASRLSTWRRFYEPDIFVPPPPTTSSRCVRCVHVLEARTHFTHAHRHLLYTTQPKVISVRNFHKSRVRMRTRRRVSERKGAETTHWTRPKGTFTKQRWQKYYCAVRHNAIGRLCIIKAINQNAWLLVVLLLLLVVCWGWLAGFEVEPKMFVATILIAISATSQI